jgi:hypothetical protein
MTSDLPAAGSSRVDEVLVARPAIPLARGEDFPARKGCGPAAMHTLEFATAREATLVIANGFAITCPMRVVTLERDGSPVAPGNAGDVVWTRVPSSPARWRLVVETAAPDALRVFTIAPRRRPTD